MTEIGNGILLNFIEEILNILLCKYNDPSKMSFDLLNVFEYFFDVKKLKIYSIESATGALKDFEKNWVNVNKSTQDYFYNDIFPEFWNNKDSFILNKSIINFKIKSQELYSNFNLDKINELYLPLKSQEKIYGALFIEFNTKNNIQLPENFAKGLHIITNQISLGVLNNTLNNQMQININFYDAMKNIAKIIESQYELVYIIPIIGEMIDRFISDHLIYVFLKDKGNNYELVWPCACNEKKVFDILKDIDSIKDKEYLVSDDQRIAAFPLTSSDNNILGAIVALGGNYPVVNRDLNYLLQLTKQSSTTIQRANLYSEILQHATLDALTGLNNRRQFEIRLNQEVATAKRKNKKLCCMMLDIDFFKKVNDTYGHIAGDIVLKNVSNIIQSQLREYDIASRYGGEEFCILLPYTTIDEAKFVASRLRRTIQDTKIDISNAKKETRFINITISVGISEFNEEMENPQDLYRNADKALYKAKSQGRNCVIIFNDNISSI